MSTCVGDSWDKLQGPPEDDSGDYNCEDLLDDCKLIKQAYFLDYDKHNSWQLKTTWLLKNTSPGLCPLIVMTMKVIDYLPGTWASCLT